MTRWTISLSPYAASQIRPDDSRYSASTNTRVRPRAAKSMPAPGTSDIADTISANWSRPCARSASTACSFDNPAGSCRPITPLKIRSVA